MEHSVPVSEPQQQQNQIGGWPVYCDWPQKTPTHETAPIQARRRNPNHTHTTHATYQCHAFQVAVASHSSASQRRDRWLCYCTEPWRCILQLSMVMVMVMVFMPRFADTREVSLVHVLVLVDVVFACDVFHSSISPRRYSTHVGPNDHRHSTVVERCDWDRSNAFEREIVGTFGMQRVRHHQGLLPSSVGGVDLDVRVVEGSPLFDDSLQKQQWHKGTEQRV